MIIFTCLLAARFQPFLHTITESLTSPCLLTPDFWSRSAQHPRQCILAVFLPGNLDYLVLMNRINNQIEMAIWHLCFMSFIQNKWFFKCGFEPFFIRKFSLLVKKKKTYSLFFINLQKVWLNNVVLQKISPWDIWKHSILFIFNVFLTTVME